MHEKLYGLIAPRAATPISDDVWLDIATVLRSTHTMNNRFDTKLHVYAFIMLILNDANKINHF